MGTRGFVGVVVDKRELIAYNHSDSYPDYLGVNTLGWLRGIDSFDAVAADARKVRVVSNAVPPTADDIAALTTVTNMNVGQRGGPPEWYQLLRETQGRLGAMIDVGYMEDASQFPYNSLSAEWGYIADLDARTFEVYAGFQREAHADGRFARDYATGGYFPVRLVASWPLDGLPDGETFIKIVEPDEDAD